VSDGRLHDGSPHDAQTQKPLDPRVRSVEVEQWVFAAVTCENSRHAKRHSIALHFACQSLDARAWWKRGVVEVCVRTPFV
jgi:hypothetical protein